MNILVMRMPAMYARCLRDTLLVLIFLVPLISIFMAATHGLWPGVAR